MRNTIINLTEFQDTPTQWLQKLQQENSTLVLTENGHASAVVQDYAHYQKQQDTLLMLKLLVQGESDVQANRLHAQINVFSELKAKLSQEVDDDA